jgi:2-polyprenyl-6-methoxyphenol hydroxylase-like FAD-dependent oxidoreductase
MSESSSGRPTAATVCVTGCGPAGALLGLLLARAGIEVVVLEKHADFLRDFRGDTVHPATLDVLAELDLSEQLHELPHRKVSALGMVRNGQRRELADFGKLKLRFPYIAFVSQWDFLDFLTGAAARYPNFRLLMNTEALSVESESGRVTGVRVKERDGAEWVVRAGLTVAADGRHSVLRRAAGLPLREFGSPMDVVLFRLSRRETDPDEGLSVYVGNGKVLGLVDRGSYWQAFFEIPRGGGYDELRRAGVERLRADVARLAPFLADRVEEITAVEETRFLEVRLNRLRRWHAPGLLFIGDAAHAMSPVGGFGINLAVQDAVAAANLLVEPLRRFETSGEPVADPALAAVQRRRRFPTVATQTLQRLLQRFEIEPTLKGSRRGSSGGMAFLPGLMARMIGIGFRPEHVDVALLDKPWRRG